MKKASLKVPGLYACAVVVALFIAFALVNCDSGSSSGSSSSGSSSSSSGCNGTPTDPTLAKTQNGNVRGVEDGDLVAFRGIPYAAPPVGDLRWRAPQDPANWSGEKDASQFGNRCPQIESPFGAASATEDCLYLNVTTPATNGSYPVMVWIHGGAFIAGSGSEAAYNPTALAQKDVVIVTLNYRLGALGFLPLAALTDEAGESGNYGIMDQQKALQWVKNNIAAFGGNPSNVTIFGESAGGHSVYTHMVTPSSKGLFHKAIAESGAYYPTQPSLPVGYVAFGAPFVQRAGITATDPAQVRAALRGMSVSDILTAQASDTYVPVTGGTFLPKSIFDAMAAGEFAQVPLLSGCNLNEGRLFTALEMAKGNLLNTEAEYTATATAFLSQDPRGLDVAKIASDYIAKQTATDPNRYRLAYSQIWTDYFFNTNNYWVWDTVSAKVKTFAYWFADVNAPDPFNSPYLKMEATHMDEIQYVFGSVGANGGTAAQVTLSDQMVGYWTTFAKQGAPAASSTWRAFTSGSLLASIKKLNTPSSNGTALQFITAHNCAYWAEPPLAAAQ
ncbi:MAG: carboxylesterase family protein [Desulfobacteraceae bacterium]|nr:carboxylesterase family protein [Desulfobacteraceae bacterium]